MSGRRHRADTEVAIVGGGPAGLTAAILLAQLGIDARVYERRSTTSRLPRAHLLNQRTMEIFESISVAGDVYKMSPRRTTGTASAGTPRWPVTFPGRAKRSATWPLGAGARTGTGTRLPAPRATPTSRR